MISKIRQGTRSLYALEEFVVDDIEEVAKLPRAVHGSTVYVIHTKEKFMIDGKGVWYPMDSEREPIECDCIEESTIWAELPEPTEN